MNSKSDNTEIMINEKLLENFFNHLFLNIKLAWKQQ